RKDDPGPSPSPSDRCGDSFRERHVSVLDLPVLATVDASDVNNRVSSLAEPTELLPVLPADRNDLVVGEGLQPQPCVPAEESRRPGQHHPHVGFAPRSACISGTLPMRAAVDPTSSRSALSDV